MTATTTSTVLEQFYAKGFYLADKEGDLISGSLDAKGRARWGKKVHDVRVYTTNQYKLELSAMLKTAQEHLERRASYNHDGLYFHYNQLVGSLRAIIAKEDDTECTYMTPRDYESFYAKNIPHMVDFCRPEFFQNYPNAQKKVHKL